MKMKNIDFEIFKKECSWFIQQTDKVEIKEAKIDCSKDFSTMFPLLTWLLSKARVADVTLTRTKKKKETTHNYRLYSWNTKSGNTAGWLCRIEPNNSTFEILPEHQLLVDNIGGIEESYEEQECKTEKLTDNQNHLFIKSKCERMDNDLKDFYLDTCKDNNLQPLNTDSLITFAVEANGNATYYDLKTKKVLLFATDHCFDYVTKMENQPEYTFYTINEVKNFVDYVEKLARQWLEEVI
jgi:hypothetical protein